MASIRAKIFGGEGVPKVFQTFNSLLGGITRKRNATLVGPSKQLVGEFPEVDFEKLYQYYHHWPHVKTAVDVMHQKIRGNGLEVTSNNEYFNVFIEKWLDVANAEKKISQFIYSFFITGSGLLELQYTPDGRLGNIEQIPMQTMYRMFRDQFGNELKLVQIVDGVFKELDPQFFIHHTINNPDRQAFGKSVFHTIASPRPIVGTVDPITNEPLNTARNSVPLLDAQAQIQNAQVEIVKKMAKPRLIVGANGMPKDQMDQIQAEMADPNNDQYIWIFDKPIQSAELQIQSQGRFEDYVTNIESMLDIALIFASNVIKNPSGFSYSGGQTPFDVLDQRMSDMQGELLELLRDRLIRPICESWGFNDFDAMEVKLTFIPTIRRLNMDDINSLHPDAVSKKERRELYKKLNIPLNDHFWDEEQKNAKQSMFEQKNLQSQTEFTDFPMLKDDKDKFSAPAPIEDEKKDGGGDDEFGEVPPAKTKKIPKPIFERPEPTVSYETPQPEFKKPANEIVIDKLIREIANESQINSTDKINIIKALERISLPPDDSNKDIYVNQGIDDEPYSPEITDPAIKKVFGLDQDKKSDSSVKSKKKTKRDLGDAVRGGVNDAINSDSDGSFKDPFDLSNNAERESNADINLNEEKSQNRDIKIGEDPMTSGIRNDDDEEIQKAQSRLDDSPLQHPSDNKGNIDGINPSRHNTKSNSEITKVSSDMKKVQDDSNPLEKEGEPLEDGLVIKGTDIQQTARLHHDKNSNRNYTDLTDEQGNRVPDLRFDQTPSSIEQQPNVEPLYEIISQNEYEVKLKKARAVTSKMSQSEFDAELNNPTVDQPNPFDLVEEENEAVDGKEKNE